MVLEANAEHELLQQSSTLRRGNRETLVSIRFISPCRETRLGLLARFYRDEKRLRFKLSLRNALFKLVPSGFRLRLKSALVYQEALSATDGVTYFNPDAVKNGGTVSFPTRHCHIGPTPSTWNPEARSWVPPSAQFRTLAPVPIEICTNEDTCQPQSKPRILCRCLQNGEQ
jgi:hypothetical protein